MSTPKRFAELWRNANDTLRARIIDQADLGYEGPRGREFRVNIFDRSEWNITRVGPELVMSFAVYDPAEDMGDVFYSKQEAWEFIEEEFHKRMPYASEPQLAFAMRLPADAATYTAGWDENPSPQEVQECEERGGHFRDNQGLCHECGVYVGES